MVRATGSKFFTTLRVDGGEMSSERPGRREGVIYRTHGAGDGALGSRRWRKLYDESVRARALNGDEQCSSTSRRTKNGRFMDCKSPKRPDWRQAGKNDTPLRTWRTTVAAAADGLTDCQEKTVCFDGIQIFPFWAFPRPTSPLTTSTTYWGYVPPVPFVTLGDKWSPSDTITSKTSYYGTWSSVQMTCDNHCL